MAVIVLIIGKSGSGKSTSLRNFKEGVGIINVLGKPLPFKNSIPTVKMDDYHKIKNALSSSKAKSIVIDDSGYLMTNCFMRGHSTNGGGSAKFDFFNKIGDEFWSLIEFANSLSNEKIVYFVMHEDKNDFGEIKPKSIGKLLDEKVCIEGMFSIVLRSHCEKGRYYFSTQSDGLDVAKSPMGLFEKEIDNDLNFVDKTIRKYYEI